ncbi:hypothetical protein FDP41_006364 [Naegleria fowleri]|uniref:Uncharacterized protein n=1 Tax=Naegleria fowleri TaxID=5763 RepID=A0A6A5BHP5_NAEFO|nr:uncharacterized protein FDP41_006364 [Naegleria fowleri]KAF0974332.1 hypothetical protein FDP41_006364 [Naegleria fowleri]
MPCRQLNATKTVGPDISGMSKEKVMEMMRKSWEKLYLTDKELQDTKQILTETKRSNENLKLLNHTLADQLKEARDDIQRYKSDLGIEYIVETMKDLKREINTLKEENRDLKREINTLKEENRDLKREIVALQEENRDLKSENMDLKREINTLKENSEVIERENKDFRSEIQTLKEWLGAVESDMFLMKHVNVFKDIFIRISDWYLKAAAGEETKKNLSQKEWQQIIPLYIEDVTTIIQISVSKKDLQEVWDWYLQNKDKRNIFAHHKLQLHESNGLSNTMQRLVAWYYQ